MLDFTPPEPIKFYNSKKFVHLDYLHPFPELPLAATSLFFVSMNLFFPEIFFLFKIAM